MPFFKKRWALEIFLQLIIAKILVRFFPFKMYAGRLGIRHYELLPLDLSEHRALLGFLRKMIPKMGRVLPWKSVCLDQALACYFILKRRRLPTTVYFGLQKKTDNFLQGHAWLRCGAWIITGSSGEGFSIVACYSRE